MLEQLMQKNALSISCGAACLIRDSRNSLDQIQALSLSCGLLLVSEEVNAKLIAMKASISCDRSIVTSYQGEYVQLSQASPDGVDFTGKFPLIAGSLLVTEAGAKALASADGALISGTLYYPDTCTGAMSGIIGEKRPYPAEAFPILGDRKLDRLLAETGAALVWVSGEVSALEESALLRAKERNVQIRCGKLLIGERAYSEFAERFHADEVELIPDGYAVTGPLKLTEAAAALYGTKLYVRGGLRLDPENADCLSQFEAIRVNGCATLPSACAKAFRAIGSAEFYRLCDDAPYTINGWETFSHERLHGMVERGEKMALEINGFALFDNDVTAEDMQAIASIVCNGFIVLPGEAQGALKHNSIEINGFTSTPENLQQMTGMTLEELRQKAMSSTSPGATIATDLYVLL